MANPIGGYAKGIGVAGMIVVLTIAVVVAMRDTFTADTSEYNAANSVLGAVEDFIDWLPILVLAIVSVLVLKYFDLI